MQIELLIVIYDENTILALANFANFAVPKYI